MMDLRRLQHLVTLADECHFARAAEKVHLSQPAFSRSIQAIEAQVGMPLFERQTGAIRPTPAGEFLIERARRMLFDARCVERDLTLYRDSRLGDTAIGAGPLATATLAQDVVATVRREFPEIGLRVEVNNVHGLLESLRAEAIEFMIADLRELPADAALEIQPLGRQSGCFFARSAHPLTEQKCSLAQAWAYGVASFRLPQQVLLGLNAIMGRGAEQTLTLALETDDIALLKSATLTSDTVLASTHGVVRAELDAGTLVQLDISDLPPLYAEIGITRLRHRTPSPAAKKLMALVEARAALVCV